jgi:hypothetical protein
MHNTPIRLTFHANATGVPLATDFARAVQHESRKAITCLIMLTAPPRRFNKPRASFAHDDADPHAHHRMMRDAITSTADSRSRP